MFLNKVCPQEKQYYQENQKTFYNFNLLGIYQSLTYLGERKYPLQQGSSLLREGEYSIPAPTSHPVPIKDLGRDWKAQVKFMVHRQRLTRRLRPNLRTIEHFPCPTAHHFITKDYATQFLLPSICPPFNNNKKYKTYQRQHIVWWDWTSIRTRIR